MPTRRQFLGRSTAVLLAVPRPPAVAEKTPTDSPADLRRAFLDPPPAARPLTRWWWFGGAVTPEEITRELTFMKEAGLRGAEIQPVYPLAVDDPARGVRNIRYFTDEWYEAVRHAVREARRLGLQLDFTLGSGWPYGGPFIPVELAARRLRVIEQDAVGPRDFAWDVTPHLTGEDRVVAVVATPILASAELDATRARVLASQPQPETAAGVRRGSFVRLRVEEGPWRIQLFLDSPTGQQVKRATVGMEGYVLDHLSREATALFLRAAGDRVLRAVREAADPPFHSVFCDSLEVYGADWTADFLAEFQKRRGYDIAPWLPAMWAEAGAPTPHVRHDYHLTLSELNLERFFVPLVAWAEQNGMKARVQAHGAPADVMQAYGLAHIPEGENIFLGDRYQVNLRHRRLASSAAHLYGKPLASSETYTWLRTPLYTTTLEQMKAATDAVLLDGLNHIVNHGYSYSPPAAGEPGWAFYASTEINHTNTWWRHYPLLAAYVQRVCAVLQEGVAVNPVAVYLPLGDLFAQFGAGGLHVDVEAEGRIGAGLLMGLRRSGYDFDVIHDHALAALARVEGGELVAGTARYRAVLVPAARFLPPESASRLLELARAGGHLVFIERVPEGTAGLADREARDARVRRVLEELFGSALPAPGTIAAVGQGTAAFVSDNAAAQKRLEAVLAPDFRIVEAASGEEAARENVGFVHRRRGAVDSYFVANVSAHAQQMRVRFAVGHRSPERWHPETGTVQSPLVYRYASSAGQATTEVELGLDPFEACFVVFGSSNEPPRLTRTRGLQDVSLTKIGGRTEINGLAPADGAYVLELGSGRTHRFPVRGVPPALGLDGPWRLTLGGRAKVELQRLTSWTDLPEGRSFSGWGTYEIEFEFLAAADVEWAIDLGRVHETAQVSLNGQPLGVAWKGRRRLPCGEALQGGRNRLTVEVANLWIQHVVAEPPPDYRALEETFGIRWGRYGEVKPERLPPSGLLGPVRLLPLQRVRLKI